MFTNTKCLIDVITEAEDADISKGRLYILSIWRLPQTNNFIVKIYHIFLIKIDNTEILHTLIYYDI
jgi:hypothetical protein